MDDFSKTGMHMTESSMMMMGSKLNLEKLSMNQTGVGSSYRWYGKMMGMTMDFSETVTKWEPPKLKEWETIGETKIIIMSGIECALKFPGPKTGLLQEFQSVIYRPKNGIIKFCLSFLHDGIANGV